MKKILLAIIASGALCGFPSCERLLEENVFNSQNVLDFYANKEQATIALNGVYSTLWDYIYKDGQYVIMGDIPGETVQAHQVRNEFDLFSWTSSTPQLNNFWIACYSGINRANTLIDRIADANIPAGDKDKIVGEAKFLRALFYFHLVKVFGGVPLHLDATLDLSGTAKARSTESEVYGQIETDLIASASLIKDFSATDHAAGHATSGAAKALLAKVYLQQRKWESAAKTAREVIELGAYDLLADFSQLWDPDFKNGKEQIFSVQNGGASNLPTSSDGVYNWFVVPSVMFNGKQVDFSVVVGGTRIEIEREFDGSDPDTYRKYHSYRDEMPYYFNLGSLVKVDDTVPLERLYLVKYFHPNLNNKELRSSVNTIVVRYADILLTYAEATNELDGPTAEALAAVNQVRRRARAVGTEFEQPASVYPDLQAGMSKDEFREAILTERAREFIGEGERRNDLIRHGRLLSSAQQQLGLNLKPGLVLYPIPDVQLSLNRLLVQNSDY